MVAVRRCSYEKTINLYIYTVSVKNRFSFFTRELCSFFSKIGQCEIQMWGAPSCGDLLLETLDMFHCNCVLWMTVAIICPGLHQDVYPSFVGHLVDSLLLYIDVVDDDDRSILHIVLVHQFLHIFHVHHYAIAWASKHTAGLITSILI